MGGGIDGGKLSPFGSKKRTSILCKCRMEVTLTTSWTIKNIGHNFYGCYKGNHDCNYFSWHDHKINHREKKLINSILRRHDTLEGIERIYQITLRFTIVFGVTTDKCLD